MRMWHKAADPISRVTTGLRRTTRNDAPKRRLDETVRVRASDKQRAEKDNLTAPREGLITPDSESAG